MAHAILKLHEEDKSTQDIVTPCYPTRQSANEITADIALNLHELYEQVVLLKFQKEIFPWGESFNRPVHFSCKRRDGEESVKKKGCFRSHNFIFGTAIARNEMDRAQ